VLLYGGSSAPAWFAAYYSLSAAAYLCIDRCIIIHTLTDHLATDRLRQQQAAGAAAARAEKRRIDESRGAAGKIYARKKALNIIVKDNVFSYDYNLRLLGEA